MSQRGSLEDTWVQQNQRRCRKGNSSMIACCPQRGQQVGYLTFDDGPSRDVVKLATMLTENGMNVTFFPTQKSFTNPEFAELYKQVRALGHDIGGHTWGHADLSKNNTDWKGQIDSAHDIFRQVLGEEMRLFRPPYGSLSSTAELKLLQRHPYQLFRWSRDSLDSHGLSHADIGKRLAKWKYSNGEIILLHFDRWAGPKKAKKYIVDVLKAQCPTCRWAGLSECSLFPSSNISGTLPDVAMQVLSEDVGVQSSAAEPLVDIEAVHTLAQIDETLQTLRGGDALPLGATPLSAGHAVAIMVVAALLWLSWARLRRYASQKISSPKSRSR